MNALAFDPWAVLARIQADGGGVAVVSAPPISRISRISRGAPCETENRAAADRWLLDIAKSIRAALSDGAEREADPEGWLLLVRPDGSRMVTAPPIVAELRAAGLLPDMEAGVARSVFASRARPPCWSDPNDRPVEGDRCTCGGRRWWGPEPRRMAGVAPSVGRRCTWWPGRCGRC